MVASSPQTLQAPKDRTHKDVQIAVLGASGYTGSEVLHILLFLNRKIQFLNAKLHLMGTVGV